MGHYYDKNPNTKSEERLIEYHYRNNNLKLTTDSGVFSKDKVDFGSDILVHTFLNEHPPGPSKSVADVGCGYGPIGLMIAKVCPHHQLFMFDINQRALALAEKNAALNHLNNVKVLESDGLSQADHLSFDYILTNPPIRAGKATVHRIFEEAYEKLNIDGELYVVIQKKQGMPSAKKKMNELFNNVEVLNKEKGYYILRSLKG